MSEMIDSQAPKVVLAQPFFWSPATLVLPGDDGKKAKFEFRVRWRRLKTSERRLLDLRLAAARVPDADLAERLRATDWLPATWRDQLTAATPEGLPAVLDAFRIRDDEFLNLLLVDWDIKDLRGTPVPFTPANRAELAEEWDGFEAAMTTAYFKAIRAEDPEKNSAPLSADT